MHVFSLQREADALVAMLRFQEYERSTVDTEGAMGLAAILAGQLPELKGKRWLKPLTHFITILTGSVSTWTLFVISQLAKDFFTLSP